MQSIQGIYDGKHILPTESIQGLKKHKVIITFVEEIDDAESDAIMLRNFGLQNTALDFWNDEKEDIYQDFLKTQ